MRTRRFHAGLLVLCSGLGLAGAAHAADASLTGSLRGAWFSSSRDLDEREDIRAASLWLKARTPLGANVDATVEGWVQREDSGSGHVGRQAVREAYVDIAQGPVDIRLGKQIIAWGRADKLNPTDNLTPRDYTLQMVDDEDQRLGVTAAQAHAALPGGFVLTAVWMPRIAPTRAALPRIQGVRFRETVPDDNQIAFKIDRAGESFDWSMSYLDGVQLNPDLALADISAAGAVVALRHQRVRVLGIDGSTVVGRVGLRAEAAYTWTRPPEGSFAGHLTRPFFYGVVGADRSFGNALNANLQYFVYRVAGYVDPRRIDDPLVAGIAVAGAAANLQLERRRHGVSFRLAQRWLNDTLEGELLAVRAFGVGDRAIRARLSYALNDHVRASVGGDAFRGAPTTFFGRIQDTSTGFAEVRFSF